MKNSIRVATYSVLNNDNKVVLLQSSNVNGKTVIIDSTDVIQLPAMLATERNQMVDFINSLTSKDPSQIRYNVSVKFNKVRRTFIRDLVKVQNQINDWVEWQISDDGKAIYTYKADLLDENAAKEAYEAEVARRKSSKKNISEKKN